MPDTTRSVICTLFEGGYHLGLAALANSLSKAGFSGKICAGYRGPLPPWVVSNDQGGKVRNPAASATHRMGNIEIAFVPFRPAGHLTNFKPNFMLRVASELAPDAERIFYFDPDINVECDWSFFEGWTDGGVALAEDVTPPMPENHPKRIAWRRIFSEHGVELRYRGAAYANGGFVGIRREQIDFVECWAKLTVIMGEDIGGLDVASLPGGRAAPDMQRYGAPFSKTDQDVLNATIEAYSRSVALLGPEIMGFAPHGSRDDSRIRTFEALEQAFYPSGTSGTPAIASRFGLLDIRRWACKAVFRQHQFAKCFLLKTARLIGRFYQAYI